MDNLLEIVNFYFNERPIIIQSKKNNRVVVNSTSASDISNIIPNILVFLYTLNFSFHFNPANGQPVITGLHPGTALTTGFT